MESYNFDTIIDRQGTNTVAIDGQKATFGRDGLMPLWVADMDFETPSFIVEALQQRLNHHLYGYTIVPDAYWQAVQQWLFDRHGWQVERQWLCYIPGIVKGIGMAVNVFTKPGDKIIIQPPVYHPFRLTPQGNGREVVFNPLICHDDGSYSMNFDHLKQIIDEKTKMLIVCNPHNPAGIVWPKEVLAQLAHICHEHGIIVISDEIHCDMTLFGHRHTPFATASDEAAQCSITFGAPSKTFNIAGIVSSYCVVPNAELRQKFYSWLEANEFSDPPMFSPIATIAAFTKGNAWREAMLHYVEDNVRFVEDYCRQHLPAIVPVRPEASFLVWLNCKGLGLNHNQLINLFTEKAHLALNDGEMFGPGGEGFMRLNVGCPRAKLKKALDLLVQALKK